MMACNEFEATLIERAAGTLAGEPREKLEDHLAQCQGCRAEAAALDEAMGLVRLPSAELQAAETLRDLPATLLAELKRTNSRSSRIRRFSAGFAIAAVALAMVLSPAAMRKTSLLPASELDESYDSALDEEELTLDALEAEPDPNAPDWEFAVTAARELDELALSLENPNQ